MKKREPNQKRGWRWRLLFWIVTILSALIVIYLILQIFSYPPTTLSIAEIRATETAFATVTLTLTVTPMSTVAQP